MGPRPPRRRRSASSNAGRPAASWHMRSRLASPPRSRPNVRSREEAVRMSTVSQSPSTSHARPPAPRSRRPTRPAIRRSSGSHLRRRVGRARPRAGRLRLLPRGQVGAMPIILWRHRAGPADLDGVGDRARPDAGRVHLRALRRVLAELRDARPRSHPQLVRDPARRRATHVATFQITWAIVMARADAGDAAAAGRVHRRRRARRARAGAADHRDAEHRRDADQGRRLRLLRLRGARPLPLPRRGVGRDRRQGLPAGPPLVR